MPQVGNPDQVAQGNRDAFSEGIGAIAQGLLKRGENQREAKRLAQTQANWDAQFAAQQEQRKIANAMQEQQFNEQKRMNDQSLLNQQRQLQKDQEQRQWLQKFYDQFFGDDEEYKELQELRKKFGGNGNAALVMMGLNPALR